MDLLSYLLSRKYAGDLISALDTELSGEIVEGDTGLAVVDSEVLHDRDISLGTILTYLHAYSMINGEHGTVSLTNNQRFPFSSSGASVALKCNQPDTKYTVITNVISADGPEGDIVVSGKAMNAFSVAHTGSAKNVNIEYLVIGGF